MSIGIAYNPCKNCQEMDKCSICELTYYRKGYIKSPTADVVEVRHGEWIVCGTFDDFLKCPLCESEKYPMSQVCNYKYCPNCGAKMDGKRSENGT